MSWVTSVRLEQPRGHVKDVECELCKEVIGKVEDMVKDQKTEDEIKAALDKVCSYLPSSVSAKCVSFVNQYADLIVTLLIQELDPQLVCAQLGLCPASVLLEQPKGTDNDVECFLCKEVIQKMEQLVNDNRTEEAIKAALDEVCSLLPPSYRTKCDNFVNKYTDLIVTLLIQELLNPQMVCAELGLCSSSVLIEQPKGTDNNVECDLCKEVIQKVADMVKDQRTEDEIKAALDKVCSYLPSSISAKCESFVNQYTDLIVTLLMQELDPQMVCAELGLCPSQIKEEKPKELKDLDCDLCKDVVAKIDEIVKENKTEDEIRRALDKVCSYLPSTIASKCEAFVNQYTDYLIAFISQDMSPGLVCAAVEICPMDDVKCEGCLYSLHFVKNELMSNETKERMKVYLKHLCSLFLPQTLAGNCEAFIDEFGNSLLVLIAQEIDPSGMCHKAGMCPSNATIPQLVPDVAIPNLNHFQIDECSICTTVVDYMDKLLEEDDVDKEITQLVEKVCVVLPASYRDKCVSMLETYGPYILQMIGQVANSKQLCQDIDLCARQAGHVHLIGGAKCTFGPSYWCHSPAHAAACKAESYCQNKVWSN
ncbi:Prosaposin [Araneus ventricosus]|uniref:Prosaposin n=1 Tax=Araneus ventricosus TaxID=182803 RepID=A0A4Y2NU07_ARAVE|nr:Prosaposin [Araneus ventricosus]